MKVKMKIDKKSLEGSYSSNEDCPLARTLKRLKYTDVGVGGYFADATKNGKKFYFEIPDKFLSMVNRALPFTMFFNRENSLGPKWDKIS